MARGILAFEAKIGCQNGLLTILRGTGELPASATVLDASGLIAAPGFIDMHSHTGLMLLEQPDDYPRSPRV